MEVCTEKLFSFSSPREKTCMAKQLSAYEQQRLDNIARNQEVLRSLGLLEDKKKSEPPKKRPRDDDDDDVNNTLPLEPSRRSDRVSRKPALYDGLTDAYFNAEEKEEGDDHPRMSSRPHRAHGSSRLTYADEYQQDVPPRRRATVRPDERRVTVHMPNLSVASSPFVDDIPNAALLQPPPRASPMGVTTGGTSRSCAHPCPICKRDILVRAKDRATGFYFLVKHWCNGEERDMVRVG
jgi:hypothetical protein